MCHFLFPFLGFCIKMGGVIFVVCNFRLIFIVKNALNDNGVDNK